MVLLLICTVVGCARRPIPEELYGIWMDEHGPRTSLTLIAGGSCEVRSYNGAGDTERVDLCTWKVEGAEVNVSVGSATHRLRFDGDRLADGSWQLVRN